MEGEAFIWRGRLAWGRVQVKGRAGKETALATPLGDHNCFAEIARLRLVISRLRASKNSIGLKLSVSTRPWPGMGSTISLNAALTASTTSRLTADRSGGWTNAGSGRSVATINDWPALACKRTPAKTDFSYDIIR